MFQLICFYFLISLFPLSASFCLLVNWFVSSFLYTCFLFFGPQTLICCCSVGKSCSTVCDSMESHARLHHLLEFAEIHVHWTWCTMGLQSVGHDWATELTDVHWVGDAIPYLILCYPLLFLLSISPSIRVFSSESVLHIRWPKYWSLSISPSNKYSGLISFRIDYFDLLVVQGILKCLLQHQNSKASIFQHSVFFMVQLSHPYMPNGKTIALMKWTFVGKVMSLLFDMPSGFVIAFLSRSKHFLISWLQPLSAVILEPKKTVCYRFHSSPIYLPWSDGTRCHDLSFLNAEF